MVPVPEAPDLRAPDARLLAGCDAPPGREHYREGVPVRRLLAGDAAALLPLPGARFDCVRWERRRADREGRVEVDGTPCCAGPHWHGRWMLVGLRAETVEIMDERGRSAATLPRSWSGGGATVLGPATPMPAVAARPRSWEQSQLRSAVPPALREGLDRCGPEDRRQVLRALRRAAESSGFEAAARAAAGIFEAGRVPDAAGVDLLARRAPGAEPVAGGGLAACDGLAARR